jgi:hypothetical protein
MAITTMRNSMKQRSNRTSGVEGLAGRSLLRRWLAVLAVCGGVTCGTVMATRVARAEDPKKPPAKKEEPRKHQPEPGKPGEAPKLPPDSPEAVEGKIDQLKEAIYKAQKKDNWEQVALPDTDGKPHEVTGGQWGGLTSIATYALLASGESVDSGRLRPAIEWLKKADIKGIYALGLRMQVWSFLKNKAEARPLIDKDAKLLLLALHKDGYYDYLVMPSSRYDHSVSQYGVLGLWAAAESDPPFEVPGKFWEMVENAWLRDQDKSGGWAYQKPGGEKEGGVRASMTAAGVATLFITQDYIHGLEGIDCKGNVQNAATKGIDAGLKWMGEHIREVQDHYTWYGIERIGVASGYKYFGTIDWYREGCRHLVPGGTGAGVPNMAFELLFLVRGRAPVMMNKLAYELDTHGDKIKESNWNERPRDAANVTHWVGKETETFLNWQIVNLKVPVEELHDAPILYIAGNQTMDLKEEEEAKLRKYVEGGGLIVCNADCSSQNFGNSLMKAPAPGKASLAQRLFPSYEVRKLPPDHPVFTLQYQRKDWKDNIDVYAVGNGSREFMLIIPSGDPAKYWQMRTIGGREGYHQIMGNVFLYTTEKQAPRFKGQTYVVLRNNAVKAEKVMKVARLEYAGNWDPEPGGWTRMANLLHNTYKLDLQVEPVKLGEGKLSEFKVAHLTGNVKFHFADKQKEELKKFTDDGGLLIVDACGGAGEFATAAETELGNLFGADAQQLQTVLPPSDAVFAAAKIEGFTYRRFAQKLLGNKHDPQLRAIVKNGKPVVYYSAQDLSVGMVGQTVEGIIGYDAPTATVVMRNILLHASQSVSGATVAGALAPPAGEEASATAAPPAAPKGPPPAKPKPANKDKK